MAPQTETRPDPTGIHTPEPAGTRRISARIAAVSPSATLAVDAKAKELQAQGERVIGFGAASRTSPRQRPS